MSQYALCLAETNGISPVMARLIKDIRDHALDNPIGLDDRDQVHEHGFVGKYVRIDDS
jgi:hypothetical protein